MIQNKIVRYVVVLWLAFTCPPLAFADTKWATTSEAIENLWQARFPTQRPWRVTDADNYDNLSDAAQEYATNTESGLVIPSLSYRHPNLTLGLKELAWALLTYDPYGNNFIPVGEGEAPSEQFEFNTRFWAEQLRSPHGNARNHLPTINHDVTTEDCPADIAETAGREAVLILLAQFDGVTNRQRWHCYANRFSTVGQNTIALTGYVEVTQIEYMGAYDHAASDGRIVYDYIQGRVFYTPAHYRQWKKADFSPDMTGGYGCTPAGTCASPFFEIIM